jgi:hypothetical protein
VPLKRRIGKDELVLNNPPLANGGCLIMRKLKIVIYFELGIYGKFE